MKIFSTIFITLLLCKIAIVSAQEMADTKNQIKINYKGPIIDVHLHTEPPASATDIPNPVTGGKAYSTGEELRDATIMECDKYNIVFAVLNGWSGTLKNWIEKDSLRFIPAPMILNNNNVPEIDVNTLQRLFKNGEAKLFGELLTQYSGLKPDDPILESYWKLAEELDVPVMIHLGTSFPGTAYHGYPNFRLSLGNPLLLEEVLVKYPKLRIWIAHGGLPFAQEVFALMQQYPQLYIDVSTINWIGGQAGRPAFHNFLQEAVARGFGKRIMFGTDQMAWPDAIGLAIEGVDSAPFLTDEQKHDIFYANAARFFKLKTYDEVEIPHN